MAVKTQTKVLFDKIAHLSQSRQFSLVFTNRVFNNTKAFLSHFLPVVIEQSGFSRLFLSGGFLHLWITQTALGFAGKAKPVSLAPGYAFFCPKNSAADGTSDFSFNCFVNFFKIHMPILRRQALPRRLLI
ncbi:MAG: hypothetical protein UY81_C0049G0010 [Candidatus Giovannonibacteria bacterium GW2011_GWA2_53_7]|uniref:Uncharacterized protein n=1 Tax=Candidatus Giovannonibacteria bacterium GW2011_GWA2_53_7 TaxID=1618650 RepID=A0A0G2AR39_9BACT|nr:MAG: hypothetical protein UY81_C0049G0010 [Candidatus Giovannonibacteria bacterium GW2011_GWA2_53_7]